MDNGNISFVIAAYTVAWVWLGAYALYVHATLRRARDEYARASGRPAEEAR